MAPNEPMPSRRASVEATSGENIFKSYQIALSRLNKKGRLHQVGLWRGKTNQAFKRDQYAARKIIEANPDQEYVLKSRLSFTRIETFKSEK